MTSPNKKILVYHHRLAESVKEGTPALEDLDKNGLGVTTEGKLDAWLHDHRDAGYQSTVKRLYHRTSNLYQVDLLTSDQVKEASSKVNHEQNVGSVKVPLKEWHLKRYRELYIISCKSCKPVADEIGGEPEEGAEVDETET